MNAFVRLAALGILAGCASRPPETPHVTVAPVAPGAVTPVPGVLDQALPKNIIEDDAPAKESCAGAVP